MKQRDISSMYLEVLCYLPPLVNQNANCIMLVVTESFKCDQEPVNNNLLLKR